MLYFLHHNFQMTAEAKAKVSQLLARKFDLRHSANVRLDSGQSLDIFFPFRLNSLKSEVLCSTIETVSQ